MDNVEAIRLAIDAGEDCLLGVLADAMEDAGDITGVPDTLRRMNEADLLVRINRKHSFRYLPAQCPGGWYWSSHDHRESFKDEYVGIAAFRELTGWDARSSDGEIERKVYARRSEALLAMARVKPYLPAVVPIPV
jgi:hypothetical protein